LWANRRWQAWQDKNSPCRMERAWLTSSMLMRMCQSSQQKVLNNLKLESMVCQVIWFIE
jgi:hypothetical protein